MAEAGGGSEAPSFRNIVTGKNKELEISFFTKITNYNAFHSSRTAKSTREEKKTNGKICGRKLCKWDHPKRSFDLAGKNGSRAGKYPVGTTPKNKVKNQ